MDIALMNSGWRWMNALADYLDGRPDDMLAMLEADDDADPPERVRVALARAIRRGLRPAKECPALMAPAFQRAAADATVAALLPAGPIPEPARVALAALVRASPLLKKPVRLTIAECRRLRDCVWALTPTADLEPELREQLNAMRRETLRKYWPGVSPKTIRESLERLKRRR